MNQPGTHALALLAATAICAACSNRPAPPGEVAAREPSAIQGGHTENGSTFAVAVLDDQGTTCSGTLIAPNLVLTARHCVANDNGGAVVDCVHDQFDAAGAPSTLRVSTAATNATFDNATHAVAQIVVPSSSAFCGDDVALLVLSSVIAPSEAATAAPAFDPPLTDRAVYGTSVVAIGYGVTSEAADDQGTRRRRDDVPIQCIPNDATLGCNVDDFGMLDSELAAGDGLCDGDSGSGAYVPSSLVSGTPLVVGVLSRGGDQGNNCTDAIYERVDHLGTWLVATAKQAATIGGYPAPTWADPSSKPATDAGGPSQPASSSGDDSDGSAPPSDGAGGSTSGSSGGCAVNAAPVRGRTTTSRSSFAWIAIAVFALLRTARRRRHGRAHAEHGSERADGSK